MQLNNLVEQKQKSVPTFEQDHETIIIHTQSND